MLKEKKHKRIERYKERFVNCKRTKIEREIKNITKERSKAPSVKIMNPLKQMKNKD